MRLFVLAMETQYAKLIFENRLVDDDTSSKHSESTGVKPSHSRFSWITTIIRVFKLALGVTTIESLKISEMVITKNSYRVVLIIYFLPFAIAFFVLIGISVPYRECVGCESFIEVPLVAVSLNSYL